MSKSSNKDRVTIESIQWMWKPPFVASLTLVFSKVFRIHGWHVVHWLGEHDWELFPPSQRVALKGTRDHVRILEWENPDVKDRFKHRVCNLIKDRCEIDLSNIKEMEYLWKKHANAIRHPKTIQSKYGKRNVPTHVNAGANGPMEW